jgi:signal transduction histidine kinase
MLPDRGHKSALRFWSCSIADLAYLALWTRLAPESWMPAACLSYALASVVLQRGISETAIVAVAASGVSPRSAAAGAIAIAASVYQRYLGRRISNLMAQHVAVRSQAQQAREAERARIAADFHDGPLQSFIGFQMRLEYLKQLFARGDAYRAGEELSQLQELGKGQVADLRRFARSMRLVDEGLSLQESLRRMAETFQRDTGIEAVLSADRFDDSGVPAQQDLLQIVREALHNVAKHAKASRVAISAARTERGAEIAVEDNGAGFPFSGRFNLNDLDRLGIGPVSIKRRVRLLDGELSIDSKPGAGARLQIQVPA